MSKVKIQGNASGTGVLTVTAPNTSTDRTITLPDSTGTLLTADGDGSSLTGVGVAGISSSADATAIKIDSSERVAIGNTDAGNYYSSADNLVVYDATQHAGITIASGGTDKTGNIYFADGTSGDAEYEGYIEYNHNGNAMSIGANHTTKVRIDSDGLKFNSDTAAANALHDYEEGTWNPTLTCTTSGSYTLDSGADTLAYTKIGRTVHIQGGINITGRNSENGLIRMTLPFTPMTGADDSDYCEGDASLYNHGGSKPNGIKIFVYGDTHAYFRTIPDNGVGFYLDHGDTDAVFQMRFSYTYLTSA